MTDPSFSCQFAGPGRGDCEHFVGLSGIPIPGQHDGPDVTKDVYGKPNGWCWTCWRSYQISQLRNALQMLYEETDDYIRVNHCAPVYTNVQKRATVEAPPLPQAITFRSHSAKPLSSDGGTVTK